MNVDALEDESASAGFAAEKKTAQNRKLRDIDAKASAKLARS